MQFQYVTFQKTKRWGKYIPTVVSTISLGKVWKEKTKQKSCSISSNHFHLCRFEELNLYLNTEPRSAYS